MNKIDKNSQSGNTLIEVLGVLSILGILTVSIIAAIKVAYDKFKISRITWQLTDLQKNINTRFAADGDYSNLNIADLIKDNVPSPTMITNANALHHTYSGNVSVAPADVSGYKGQNKAFTITFENLPFNVCTELLTINWQANNYSELVQIDVGGNVYKWADKAVQSGSQNSLPMDLARASTACKAGDLTTVTWTFF